MAILKEIKWTHSPDGTFKPDLPWYFLVGTKIKIIKRHRDGWWADQTIGKVAVITKASIEYTKREMDRKDAFNNPRYIYANFGDRHGEDWVFQDCVEVLS